MSASGERLLRSLLTSLLCWPFEALFAMWGLGILNRRGFPVPAPGYWSSFIVCLALGFVYASVTLTRRSLEESER
jgi:hypothetical protein